MARHPRCFLLAVLFTLPNLAAASASPTETAPLAVVGGEPITLQQLDVELRQQPPQALDAGRLPSADDVLRRLIQNRMLEQEGFRLELQDRMEVRSQVKEFIRLSALEALVDSISASVEPLSEEAIDDLLDRETRLRRYSHVLVADSTLALALRDSLDAGIPLAALARRHSTDNTAARGGDLGWAPEGSYVAPFEAAGKSLAPGEFGGPVQTQFGWHLLQLEEERVETAGQSEEMRKALRKALQKEHRTNGVREYVFGLYEKHGITVNDSLLASLDLGAEGGMGSLKGDPRVLVTLPSGRLTVDAFYRVLLFKYFHGLDGRPNANDIRDQVFGKWVDEAVLSLEARTSDLYSQGWIQRSADALERSLLREQTVSTFLGNLPEPSDEEIRRFYAENTQLFMSDPRLRVRSAQLQSTEAAAEFRRRLESGAVFSWALENTPGVVDGMPPFGSGWIEPATVGIDGSIPEVGTVLAPLPAADAWIVAKVVAVAPGEPIPFEKCRPRVVHATKRAQQHETLSEAMQTLESATEVTVADEALARIQARIDAFLQERAEEKSNRESDSMSLVAPEKATP